MKKYLLPTILLASTLTFTAAQTIYLTGEGSVIRRSTDNGASFANWVTGGSQFAGITLDSSGNVLVADRGAGNATARPLYAIAPTTANGTGIGSAAYASTTFDDTDSFNRRPVAFFNGRVFVNSGRAGGTSGQGTGSYSWDGTTFSSFANAGAGNWQGNDFIFGSSGGTDYAFMTGTSGANLRRWTVTGSSFSSITTVTLSGMSGNTQDIWITPSGRLMALNSEGIWLSAPSSFTSASITMSNVFSFSTSENTLTGDMGANARDFYLFGSTLYAVTNTNLFRYSYDDSAGSFTFLDANSHGLNTPNLHIVVIPEPATWFLIGSGLSLFTIFRKRRRVALT